MNVQMCLRMPQFLLNTVEQPSVNALPIDSEIRFSRSVATQMEPEDGDHARLIDALEPLLFIALHALSQGLKTV